MQELAEQLDSRLESLGFEKENSEFRPHITLARCRQPADVRPLVTALTGYAGTAWMADRIHLIRSWPGPRPRYESLGDWPLRVPPSG